MNSDSERLSAEPVVVVDRRQRKRERTRAELLRAARSLVAERGTGFRVSDVTERSDVALGSFYAHFEAKDDLIAALVEESVAAVADSIGDLGDQLADPAEGLAIGVRRLVGLCRTDPEVAALLVRLPDAEVRFERLLWSRAEPIMRRGAETGRFETPDPGLSLRIAIASVMVALRAALAGETGPEPGVTCAVAVLRSIGIEAGEARRLALSAGT